MTLPHEYDGPVVYTIQADWGLERAAAAFAARSNVRTLKAKEA